MDAPTRPPTGDHRSSRVAIGRDPADRGGDEIDHYDLFITAAAIAVILFGLMAMHG